MLASAGAELIEQIEHALTERGAQKRGAELYFRCFNPDAHTNGDAHVSARWHIVKQTWFCDVCKAGGGYINLARELGIELHTDAERKRRIVATYDYRDESGLCLYQAVRYDPKDFRQRRPDGAGKWIWNLDGVRRVPYRLPELLAAPTDQTVFVPEGEKDVDTLRAAGLIATCNVCGADKWRTEYNEHLGGRHVVVIPDADKPGRRHADDVTRQLLGVAASVRRLELNGAKDVSEWLAAGHTAAGLVDLARSVPAQLEAQPATPRRVPVIVRLSEVEPKETSWVWKPYVPRAIGFLDGDPGIGKGFVVCALTATITRAAAWPTGELAPYGEVLLLNAEDGMRDVLWPRLEAAGADLNRVHCLRGLSDGGSTQAVTLQDVDVLRAALETIRPVLVVVDPIQAYLGANVDMHRANETRPVLTALSQLAEEFECAILCVRHLTKGGRDKALYRGLGSIDFVGAARSVLLVGVDPADDTRLALAHLKCSLAPKGPTLGFVIEDRRLLWTGQRKDLTAAALVAPEAVGLTRHTKTADAVAFLEIALDSGPRGYSDLLAEAEAADISKNTLIRASKKLGLVSESGGFPRRTTWQLPHAGRTGTAGRTGVTEHWTTKPSSPSSRSSTNTAIRARGEVEFSDDGREFDGAAASPTLPLRTSDNQGLV
jgi:5S rRNA maturation endonuclease (ribonuclease M5)